MSNTIANKLSDISCGDCSVCCTSPREEQFRTPTFEEDRKLKKVLPEYEHSQVLGCHSCKYLNVESGMCEAYSKRPIICSLYPLYPIIFNGSIKLGVSLNCHHGRAIFDAYQEGGEEFLTDLKNKLSEVKKYMTLQEIKKFSAGIHTTYSYMTILNLK